MRFIFLKQPVWIGGVLTDPSGGAVEVDDATAHELVCAGGGIDVTTDLAAVLKPTKAAQPARTRKDQ